MWFDIINLYEQGLTECQIAARLGISVYDVAEVLDEYFSPDYWYDEYDYYDEEW